MVVQPEGEDICVGDCAEESFLRLLVDRPVEGRCHHDRVRSGIASGLTEGHRVSKTASARDRDNGNHPADDARCKACAPWESLVMSIHTQQQSSERLHPRITEGMTPATHAVHREPLYLSGVDESDHFILLLSAYGDVGDFV